MIQFATAILDETYAIKSANIKFFDVFGSKIQRSLSMLIHEDDLKNFENAVENLSKNDKETCVARLETINGEYITEYICLTKTTVDSVPLIEAHFIDLLSIGQAYDRENENYQLIKQHLINMELLCFEFNPKTSNITIFINSLNQSIIIYNGNFTEWKQKMVEDARVVGETQLDAFDAMCYDIESCKENFKYHLKSSIFSNGESVDENIIRCSSIKTDYGNTFVIGTVAGIENSTTINVENTYSHSHKDPMTGVLNKEAIIHLTQNRIYHLNKDESIVIAILDLDNFKLVNDTFGHLYGDKIIIQFAGIISRTIGNRGIVGRFGGDEFMIMLEGIKDEMHLRSVLRAIRTSVELEFKNIGDNISLTTSIGAATFPKDAKDYDELFTKADYCLYLSKMRGKNRYVMFDYMVKEHHYLNDKLLLKRNETTMSRYTYTTTIVDLLMAQNENTIPDILKLVAEKFDLGRIRIYMGKDLKLAYYHGIVEDENEDFESIYEDNYLDAFNNNDNAFVINYLSNIEVSYPTVFKHLTSTGTLSAVQYLMGNKYHINGIISFETTTVTRHWPEDAIFNFKLIGYLIDKVVMKNK